MASTSSLRDMTSTYQVTSDALIGRTSELQTVSAKLIDPETQLLTLTGTAGVGKTSLALAALGQLGAHFEQAHFVGLSSVRQPDLVFTTILREMGARERGATPLTSLQAALGERQHLLVLDNFEQVLAAAQGLGELLDACPNVSALVTSREPLRLGREMRFDLAPLALPEETATYTLERLEAVPAVALFARCAEAARASFRLTEANADAVV